MASPAVRLESVLFEGRCRISATPSDYQRMARVLELSAAENSPLTPLTLRRLECDDADIERVGDKRKRKHTYVENTRKTRHHADIIHEATDGELICLIDCDTIVMRDLSSIADQEFDLAYTARPNWQPYKINTGVYFVRVSPVMRQWMERWFEINCAMLADEKLHLQWRPMYGGINQASLGYLLEYQGTQGIPKINAIELECDEWNSVSNTWKDFGQQTRVVHVMTDLRKACLGKTRIINKRFRPIVDIWRAYDQRAKAIDAMGRTDSAVA